MIFITNFQFQVHMTCLSGYQMGQSPMVTRLALEQPVRVQFEILLNRGLYFEYTQLLPGAVLIQLILDACGSPLLFSSPFTTLYMQIRCLQLKIGHSLPTGWWTLLYNGTLDKGRCNLHNNETKTLIFAKTCPTGFAWWLGLGQ